MTNDDGRISYGTGRDVNPDAGSHAIANDPTELVAADEATRRSWREFPYYPRRYGERGRRFSLSDGGWLTTLCDATPAAAFGQALWLGSLLGARGMPHLLLERHLEHLHGALIDARPEAAARYDRLVHCVDQLRERRLAVLDAARFEDLAREFDTATAAMSARVPNMGRVLVAAVVDERSGVRGIVANVTGWATDAARFGADWCAAVRTTVAAAAAR